MCSFYILHPTPPGIYEKKNTLSRNYDIAKLKWWGQMLNIIITFVLVCFLLLHDLNSNLAMSE